MIQMILIPFLKMFRHSLSFFFALRFKGLMDLVLVECGSEWYSSDTVDFFEDV